MIIKCLSLWAPYSDLIVDGRKTIETRFWNTKYRGWLLIHTACRTPKNRIDIDSTIRIMQQDYTTLHHTTPLLLDNYEPAYGHVIGVVYMSGAYFMHNTFEEKAPVSEINNKQ